MAVNAVLDQIVQRYPEVIGALVHNEGNVYHNLQAPYDLVSAETVMETFAQIFELTGTLEEEGHSFSDMILDFDTHSFVLRVIENDALLVILTGPSQRGQLVKLQVGLGLFARQVSKALNSSDAPAPAEKAAAVVDEKAPAVEAAPETEATPATDDSAGEATKAAPAAEPEAKDEASQSSGFGFGNIFGKRQKAKAVDAVGKPEPKIPELEKATPEKTGKKVRYYRGVAYYD